MLTQSKSLSGLVGGYKVVLDIMGYSITTKLLFVRRAELMVNQHLNAGLEYFDQAVINCYISGIDDKYFKGGMQKRHYERTKREIDCFVSYVYAPCPHGHRTYDKLSIRFIMESKILW